MKTFKKSQFIILLSSTCFFMQAGLSNENNGFYLPNKQNTPEQRYKETGMNEVVFVDHGLNRTYNRKQFLFWGDKQDKKIKVSVESHGIRTTAGDTAEVWVSFRNHSDYPVQIEGRTSFFFKDRSPAYPDPHWKKLFIPANSLSTYKEQSWDNNIGYYRVEVKEADK